MTDADVALSIAYGSLLANLSYNNKPVKLYDLMAPDDAQAPYVILGPWIPRSDNTKDTFGQKGEINLDVVTRFGGGAFSKKPANDIANAITTLLKPTPEAEVLQAPGWGFWMTVIGAGENIALNTDTDRIYRKIITVSHNLEQL